MSIKSFLMILILLFSTVGCPKKEDDNTIRNLLILGAISRTSSTANCSGQSKVVVCVPKGIAE
ncbi:MAG: hypothetical protein SFU98_06515 [Leptospiraceae bacterium]|nr:hypothetical protein [Leptospiraceae bacterium]